MLASFKFGNLGLFAEEQSLDFKPAKDTKGNFGILIGANATGKSSCIDFMGLCMSSRVINSKSRIDLEKPGWALASFKIDIDTLRKCEYRNTIEAAFGNLGVDNTVLSLWTGVIFDDRFNRTVRFIQLDKCDGPVCLTEVTSLFGEKPRTIYQRYEKPIVVNGEIPVPYPDDLLDIHEAHDQSTGAIYSSILGVISVVTCKFDHMGVCATASTRNAQSCIQKETYTTSEALMLDLLQEIASNGKRTEYEKLASRLTISCDWKFTVTNFGQLKVSNSALSERRYDLLRVPTGVYQAHLIALLLTTADAFSTVIIDDPKMDPEMTENLRESIIDFVKKKHVSVIIASHAEQFVSRATWQHVYRFGKCNSHTLFCHDLPATELDELKAFYVDEVRKWFSCRSLILVEGITDKIVLEALLCILREMDKYQRLAGAKVVQCKGNGNLGKVHEFLKEFRITTLSVYDADALGKRASEKMWVMENTLAFIKLGEKDEMPKVVQVKIGKSMAQAIRIMLNNSYVRQERDTGLFCFEYKTIKQFEGKISQGKPMLYYIWKKLNECPECQHLCEAIQFILTRGDLLQKELADKLPMYDSEQIAEDFAQMAKASTDTDPYSYKLSEIRYLLMVEHLLSAVWTIRNNDTDEQNDSKTSDVPDGCSNSEGQTDEKERPFYWGCGTIEDVINITLRRKFHYLDPPRPWLLQSLETKGTYKRQNCIWFCQKHTLGKIDALSHVDLTELCCMLIGDQENHYFQKFLEYLLTNYQGGHAQRQCHDNDDGDEAYESDNEAD